MEDQQRVGTVGGRNGQTACRSFVRSAVLPRLACAHSLVPVNTVAHRCIRSDSEWCGIAEGLRLRLPPSGPCLAHRIGVRPRLTISDLISQTRRSALSRVLLGYSSGPLRCFWHAHALCALCQSMSDAQLRRGADRLCVPRHRPSGLPVLSFRAVRALSVDSTYPVEHRAEPMVQSAVRIDHVALSRCAAAGLKRGYGGGPAAVQR